MEYAAIIPKLQSGNSAAQNMLYKKLSERMFIVCRRYINNPEDAEERMQDGFCKVYRKINGFDYKSDAGFVSWMREIMINTCLEKLRRKNNFRIVPVTDAEQIAVEDNILNKISATEMYNVILTLPDGCRTVFNLYAIDGFEHKKIGQLLDISEITSRTQLLHARKLLQKKLKLNKKDHATTYSKSTT